MDTEHVEQDKEGGDDLPTYEDAAARSGPNSRFGRWAGWVEKRAAERYHNITQEERTRQRARGWGNDLAGSVTPTASSPHPEFLRVQTDFSGLPVPSNPPIYVPERPSQMPASSFGTTLAPAHLSLNQFGSRFLPHTTARMRCLLPLPGDRLLLIGHEEGLSVLDMFPQEWNETGGIEQKGPAEARVLPIWLGEVIYQMTLLEVEQRQDGTTLGVILFHVGVKTGDNEPVGTLRMHSLASLMKLATWYVARQGAGPLILSEISSWNAQLSPSKKHRSQASLAIRGIKSLLETSPAQPTEPRTPSRQSMRSSISDRETPIRADSGDSTWEVVDDGPLRWAADCVPFARTNTRLVQSSVLFYTLWSDDGSIGGGAAFLAVVTKSNIFLFESPKGERIFRFSKEFYTPVPAQSVTFVLQSVETVGRRGADSPKPTMGHRRSDSAKSTRSHRTSLNRPLNPSLTHDPQLSLFVTFDKKAGWIRLADSAVGEIEMYEDLQPQSTILRRSRDASPQTPRLLKSAPVEKATKGPWAPPTRLELPVRLTSLGSGPSCPAVHVLTKGKVTHIVPSPLLPSLSTNPPLYSLSWQSVPSQVIPRLCNPEEGRPFIQLVAFGEGGLEVQEIPLSLLSKGKGKSRDVGALPVEPVRAEVDVGGQSSFLCAGGHWHRPKFGQLSRSDSTASYSSFASLSSEEIVTKLRAEEGIYGWCRKGLDDWRVFWVGGDGSDDGVMN